jgi:hypothetical protein
MITRVSIEATEQQFLVNSTSLGRPNYQQLSIQYRVSPFFSFVVVLKQFCRVVCCLRAESCSAFFLVVCRVELWVCSFWLFGYEFAPVLCFRLGLGCGIVISIRQFISLEPASLPPCTRCSQGVLTVWRRYRSCTHTVHMLTFLSYLLDSTLKSYLRATAR